MNLGPARDRPHLAWRLLGLLFAWAVGGTLAGLAVGAVLLWDRLGVPSRQRIAALAGLAVIVTAVGWLAEGAPYPTEIVSFARESGRAWVDGAARVALGLVVACLLVADEVPTTPRRTAAIPPVRLPEVDRLRAIAIVAVVLIHGLPFRPPPSFLLDYWLSDVLRFSVATLVFVSGWLLPPGRPGLAWVRRRLARLLPAYLVASVLMMVLARLTPLIEARPVVESLLLGRAVGPYYYVFVLVTLVAATPVLARIPRPGRWVLLVAALASSLAIEVSNLSLVLHNQLPLTWLGWYLAGWLLRPHRDTIMAFARRWQAPTGLAATGVLVALMFFQVETTQRRVVTWLGMLAVLAALLLFSLGTRSRPHALTESLSTRSYLIYLYHPPIVAGLAGVLGNSVTTWIPVWSALLTVGTCLAIAQLARVAWPEHARQWVGA